MAADNSDGRQHHLVTAVFHLARALETDENTTNDLRKLLEDLNFHLSTRFQLDEREADDRRQIESCLASAETTILNFHSIYSNIFDSGQAATSEYFQAVADVADSITRLEGTQLRPGSLSRALFDQAQSIQQIAMARLEKELVHILVQNKHCFEQDYVVQPAGEAGPVYEESVVSNEDESVNVSRRESSSTEIEDYAMDLIHPDVIPHVRSIATAMFQAKYDREFCLAFTVFWQDMLAECLTMLDVEQSTIEEILQMEWKHLYSRIKKWCLALRRFDMAYLASAKRLFDQVLQGWGNSSDCLIEASKPSLLRLLNFGHAVSIRPHGPEWLFCLIEMYEALSTVISDMNSFFPESVIRVEFNELLTKLGESAMIIFKDLGFYIASCQWTTPFSNGGIPHITKYLINYILLVAEYHDTLSLLLQANSNENLPSGQVEGDVPGIVGGHLQSWTSILEENLDQKSNLYNNTPLKHIFMMNNIYYMVRKISKSKSNTYFGDDWIRAHIVKYRQHAKNYERATWGPILPLLHVDGKTGKATLKARCREFAAAFEDVYKNQTRWSVPDINLREELRISASGFAREFA